MAVSDEARWYSRELQPHEPALRAFLHRHYPKLVDVDEVVQVSLLKTFREWQKGTLNSVRGFLYAAARNHALDLFRSRKFIAEESLQELAPLHVLEDDADLVESVCSRDELLAVADAVAQLPDRRREIVTLRLLEGLDYDEIARRCDVSPETARVTVAKGMRQVTMILKERGVIAEREP